MEHPVGTNCGPKQKQKITRTHGDTGQGVRDWGGGGMGGG